MKEIVLVIVGIVFVFLGVAGTALGLTELGVGVGRKPSQMELDFRAACSAVKGNAVYNGRHWECLK